MTMVGMAEPRRTRSGRGEVGLVEVVACEGRMSVISATPLEVKRERVSEEGQEGEGGSGRGGGGGSPEEDERKTDDFITSSVHGSPRPMRQLLCMFLCIFYLHSRVCIFYLLLISCFLFLFFCFC